MNFNQFKQETTSFINELNNLLFSSCGIIFDKNCQYGCCFNPKLNSVIFNYDLLNQNNELSLDYLGNNYFKYYILHEYGHNKYNSEVEKHIKSIPFEEPLLKFFRQQYNFWINNLSQIYPFLSINTEHFWIKQYDSAGEFMADYFVIEQINKNFNYLNSISFKLWRAKEVLNLYEHCNNNNGIHIEHLRYYHIPETILDKNINFRNDITSDLINLSLNNSLMSLILTYNHCNNLEEYNATNFGQKISGIIEELNELR